MGRKQGVLILVVMDNGLVPLEDYPVVDDCDIVLILVVMDNGLVLSF